MGHEPRRSVGAKAKAAEQLMRADALFAGAKQMRGQQPFVHRDMRALVNGPDGRRELLYALMASVKAMTGCFACDFVGGIDDATVGANRTMRPSDSFEVRPSGVFIVENRVGEIDRHKRLQIVNLLSHFAACLSSA